MIVEERIAEVIAALNVIELRTLQARGYVHVRPDGFKTKVGRKFINLDHGTSGAWLIEKATGEIYNIKGYGVADYNKKKKADIGNIFTVDPEFLFTKQYNYLR